ncbi:hypothetical protein BTS2_0509 [Bacillus sp. TS-2]|nr:hypothetical protein BTS2_0509 [Bacillus sp. TS-2]
MKNGKRPTKAQKISIKEAGLNYDNWLVSKSLEDELHLVHRYTGTKRKIYK